MASVALSADEYQTLERRLKRNARLKLLMGQVLVGLAFLAFWQAVYQMGVVKPLIARSPKEVWDFFVKILLDGTLLPALYSTLEATVIAFILASAVGIVIGIGLGLFPKIEALIDPYLSAINAMPRIAFAPVFILLFGIDQSAKIALAFSVVVFILIVSARAGIRTIDNDILTMARAMNINKRQMFMKILLPSAVPSIFGGLRLGVIYSLLGVTTSEILASEIGLGQLVAWYAGIFALEGVYAVVIVLAVVASLINVLMAMLEKKILKHRAG
ncbi:ABC transporter permease [Leisingera thetidis]|uniref:ABC transporter permease n=1 Tax=Leisingera thetidis TaxID=2930199 RepID=UPI0021F7C60B|nr:ABC transporter permease [Leisingera thetidis]